MSDVVLRTTTGLAQILTGELSLGREGAWVAHLELGETAAPTGGVTIEFAREGSPPVLFVGTVAYGDDWQGRQKIVVYGGAGGLDPVSAPKLPFREYLATTQPVPAAQLVRDVVGFAVEQLAPDVLDSLAGLGAPRWARAEGTEVSRALTRICRYFGRVWRVLDDGTIWVGVETWPTVPNTAVSFLEGRDGDAIEDAAAPAAAVLRPGTTVLGKRVERVTYQITGEGSPRVKLLYRNDVDDFARAVRRVSTPDPYALMYGAQVAAQNADGTLELLVDSTVFPELRSVPFKSFTGAHESIPVGTRLIVAFLGGREDGAFAWGQAQDPGATAGVARVGDTADAGTLTAIADLSTGAVSFDYAAPSGAESHGPTATLTATINSGSRQVRIR